MKRGLEYLVLDLGQRKELLINILIVDSGSSLKQNRCKHEIDLHEFQCILRTQSVFRPCGSPNSQKNLAVVLDESIEKIALRLKS
uniref:Uncharacterized protein n=1 Tax=Romanomermis culicivorax TaxID=13658 RepID=A0A915K7J2_ROMCU